MRPFTILRCLVLALAAIAPLARGQVVLDTFSTDLRASYTFKTGDDTTWYVNGGNLLPQTSFVSGTTYSAWIWSGGHTLSNVGDSFAIDLSVSAVGGPHNGGLAVWTNNTANTDPSLTRIFEPRLAFDTNSPTYSFGSEFNNLAGYQFSPLSGAPSGFATLSVTLTARTATTSTLTATLTGSGFTPLSHDYVVNFTDPLFVGPSTYLPDGSNVVFDNLTYSTSAIPEPSTYAILFGVSALGIALWRRQRSSRGRPAGAR